MNKLVDLYNGILIINKKERNIHTCKSMDESKNNCDE